MIKHYNSHCYIFYLCDYLNSKKWIFRGQRHAYFEAFWYILFNYPSKKGSNLPSCQQELLERACFYMEILAVGIII